MLELAEGAPSQPSATAVEQPKAAEPVNGAPIAQLQVGAAPLKSQIPDGRTQVEYAAWRQLQLNPAQVALFHVWCACSSCLKECAFSLADK